MKILKLILYSIFTSLILLFYGCVSNSKNGSALRLSYDKKTNSLIASNASSATTVRKITLDLKQDTLFFSKVSMKLVPFHGEKSIRKCATCIIKLQPHIKFVKLDNTLFRLSDIYEYSQEELINRHTSVLIIFPSKYPYIVE